MSFSPLPPFILAGRINFRGVMCRAIDAARSSTVAASWRQRMSEALRWAWNCAKYALTADKAARAEIQAATPAPAPASKLQLDRAGALRVLTAIQNRGVNFGRDIVTAARALPDLDAVLTIARAEFRKLTDADRTVILEVARAAAKPSATVLPLRSNRYPASYGRTFTRGSRAHSHGW